MAVITGGGWLEPFAASQFNALQEAHKARWGYYMPVISAGRTKPEQAYLYNGWILRLPGFSPAYPADSPFALHVVGGGQAVDAGGRASRAGTAEHKWLAENGPLYGFAVDAVKGEPWHIQRTLIPSLAGLPITSLAPDLKEDDDMAQPFYYIADSNNASVTVGKGDVWVRSAPGEPLRRLTAGQAQDFFARDGLDYNSPNVVSKPGSWFDLAFTEDAIAAGYNVTTHPYLSQPAVTVSLDAGSIAAIEAALADELAAIPDAVRQNIKAAL